MQWNDTICYSQPIFDYKYLYINIIYKNRKSECIESTLIKNFLFGNKLLFIIRIFECINIYNKNISIDLFLHNRNLLLQVINSKIEIKLDFEIINSQ